MKWIVIVALALVALGILVVVIGALLPRDHTVSLAARIPAPPEAVWGAITDPSHFPNWRPDVQSVELLAPVQGQPSWREVSNRSALTMVVDASSPPAHLVTRIADQNLPFGGTWDYRVEADGDSASRVTVTERGTVYNPLFRFVSRFVMGHTATIDTYLRALGSRFGADVEPSVVTPPGGTHGL